MPPQTKVLVAIANWGTKNDAYLAQLINEYQSMSFDVDVVVLSNLQKEFGDGVESVKVDLRGKDPWSLPFAHKAILASRVNEYDLFVYSEDDTLVTEKNLRAFQSVSGTLSETEVAGFFRFEKNPQGELHFPDVHGHFHWIQFLFVRRVTSSSLTSPTNIPLATRLQSSNFDAQLIPEDSWLNLIPTENISCWRVRRPILTLNAV